MKLEVLKSRTTGEVNLWEEVPSEDLWEDGELDSNEVKDKLYHEVVRQGEWKVVRRIDEPQ